MFDTETGLRSGRLSRRAISRHALGCSSALGLLFGLNAPANAQATAEPRAAEAPDAARDQSGIGDIIVTARRVSERLQDIPASISAVSGDQIGKMSSLNDIQSLVSGVTFKNQGSAVLVGMRGFGNRAVNGVPNATVGVFQDGIFVPSSLIALDSRTDVSRIEVAKGPQSTLFGRSTYAGAINIVTNDPTPDFSGYVEGGLGGSSSHGEFLWHVQGVLSGPITDTLSVRVFGLREKRDGYTYDPVSGYRGNGYDRSIGRIKFLWQPTENLAIRLSGTLMHDNAPSGNVQSGTILAPLGANSSFGNPLVTPTFLRGPDIWRGTFLTPPEGKRDGQQATLDIRYRTSIGELALLTDYTHSNTYERSSGGTSSLDNVHTFNISDEKRFSQEIRLSNKVGRVSYLAGLYYLYSNFEIGRPGATLDLNAPATQLGAGTSFYDLAGIAAIYSPGYIKTNAYAAFAQVGFDITDKLNLTIGLRQSRDEFNGTTSNTILTKTGALLTTVPTTPQSAKFDATTGTANLSYKISPDALIYASYTRGDSPGGYNSGAAAALNYSPQKVDAYEIGLKGTFFDKHLRINAALFQNDYKSIQFFQSINFNGTPATVTLNAANARGRGIDLDAVAVLNNNIRFGLQYTYQKSKITNYNIPAPPAPQVSFLGEALVRSPEHSLNASMTFSHDIGPGKFEFTAAENYTSSYNNDYKGVPAGTAYPGRPGVPAGVTTSQVLALFRTPGYAITNLDVSYSVGNWEISGFVRNVFNHQYIEALVSFDPMSYGLEVPGEPRTFMGQVKFKF